MINAHELTHDPVETFFSVERDAEGIERPTLWDHEVHNGQRAVCLVTEKGITITTIPEVVEEFLGAE